MNMMTPMNKLLGPALLASFLLDIGCGGTIDLTKLHPGEAAGSPNGSAGDAERPTGTMGWAGTLNGGSHSGVGSDFDAFAGFAGRPQGGSGYGGSPGFAGLPGGGYGNGGSGYLASGGCEAAPAGGAGGIPYGSSAGSCFSLIGSQWIDGGAGGTDHTGKASCTADEDCVECGTAENPEVVGCYQLCCTITTPMNLAVCQQNSQAFWSSCPHAFCAAECSTPKPAPVCVNGQCVRGQ